MWEELSNWDEYTKIFAGIFATIAPPIIIAPYLTIISGHTMKEKRQTAMLGVIGFCVTLWLFIFFGSVLLEAFGISLAAFRMAGGLLLMLMALSLMKFESPEATDGATIKAKTNPTAAAIVPLAIPVLAGPGAISTVVVFSNSHEGLPHKLVISAVVLALALYALVTLRLVAASEQLIGPNATLILNKIAGLVLCAIAFEFLFHGIAGHFPQLEIIE